MKNTEIYTMSNLFDQLVLEAKLAFIKRFPYLGITETTSSNLIINDVVRDVPGTDGSFFVHIKGHIVVPFSAIKPLFLDKTVAHFNYAIHHVFTDGKVSLSLQRFYYHTKDKNIFGM